MSGDSWQWALLWGGLGGTFGARINSMKGYSGLEGFLYGVLLGPFVLLLNVRRDNPRMKRCPYCAKWAKKEATVCKLCRTELPEQKS